MARTTKSIDAMVAKQICLFLRTWLLRYYPDPTTATGFHGSRAAEHLKLSQGYLSELGRIKPTKKPGLNVVLRLREQTGATFEEITGHRAPLQPPRPLGALSPNAHIAEAASDEASSRASDERSSSTHRAAHDVGPPRKKRDDD
jgi:hypothetical protein